MVVVKINFLSGEMVLVLRVINMNIVCPHCKKIIAKVEKGVMVQGSAKCLCGESFGYSNVRRLEEIQYFY